MPVYTEPNLKWNLDLSCSCTKATFTETTCFATSDDCCDGYDVSGNYPITEVVATKFTILFPSGAQYLNHDFGYVPTEQNLTFDILISDLQQVSYDNQTVQPPNWEDGVYTMVYMQYDINGIEIGRKTRKFLMDCNVRNCIKRAMLRACGECKCSVDDLIMRIAEARTWIEVAWEQFENESYDCAQEAIDKAGKICDNICLDC